MPEWKLIIEYDGTRYHGWQEQKNSRTVAGLLRNAASEFFGAPVLLGGAGRTDSGVHALGQVAHLRSSVTGRAIDIRHGLNDRLPADINVISVEEARPGFDARRDAKERFYIYQISTRRTAFAKPYVWWVKDRLDPDLMNASLAGLRGRRDYAAFCDKRSEDTSTIVEVTDVELALDGDLILFRIGASHFLWKMVRRIVGTMVEVGRGRISPDIFKTVLAPHGRSRPRRPRTTFDIAAHTAPPSGLFLHRVVYEEQDRPDSIKAVFPVD